MEVVLIFLIIIVPSIIPVAIVFVSPKKVRIPEIELNIRKKQRFERVRWIFNEQPPASGCPVIFLRGAVLKDKATRKNLLQLMFINAGTQTIKSAYAAIDFIDDAGDRIASGSAIQAEYLDINCASGDTFGQKQLLDLGEIGATHIVITYSKIVFADGTVWRAGTDAQTSSPVPVTLLKNTLPPELQSEVSEETICKPETLDNGLWRCTCGCLVRNIDGDTCPNCQQTLEQARESASVSVLEKRKRERIAEQKQKALDEQDTKKETASYIKQFFCSIITAWAGLFSISGVILNPIFNSRELNLSEATEIFLIIVLMCICYTSVLSTAFLARKARNGDIIRDSKPSKIVTVQKTLALVLCLFNCVTVFIFCIKNLLNFWREPELESIGLLLLFIITFILACFLFRIQVPHIYNRLMKYKRIIALAICGIFILNSVVFIAQIPGHIHVGWFGNVSIDSEIVLPCAISIVLAVVSALYCCRPSIVKGWLEKLKSRKREK